MLYFFLSVESVESVQSASKVGKGDFVEAGAEGETLISPIWRNYVHQRMSAA